MLLCFAVAATDKITVPGNVVCETVVRRVGRNLDLSSVDSKWLNYRGCGVCIDEQSRGIAYVAHVDEKGHESSSCLLFDFDDGDGDEHQASSNAGSFMRCASTRSSS